MLAEARRVRASDVYMRRTQASRARMQRRPTPGAVLVPGGFKNPIMDKGDRKKNAAKPEEWDHMVARPAKYFTLIVIPGASGAPRRFTLPLMFVHLVTFFLCLTTGAVIAMSTNYFQLKGQLKDLDKLQKENHSIRSEAAALAARLKEIQTTLKKVDEFSEDLSEASMVDPRKTGVWDNKTSDGKKSPKPLPYSAPKKSTKNQSSSSFIESLSAQGLGGIGPVTKEEMLIKNQLKKQDIFDNINYKELEFKDIFSTLIEIENTGSYQAVTLRKLLKSIQNRNNKLQALPTLVPVQGFFTSGFGYRASPIDGATRMHYGVDLSAPVGTPIRAPADGVVTTVRYVDDYGRYLEIAHGYGVSTRFAHTERIVVRPGEQVQRGAVVAYVGMTGRTTGPHLHYEIEQNGRRINPSPFLQLW